MVQDNEIVNDGADERMLNENEDAEKLTGKKEEIKFIPAEKNGDAKIDIGEVDKKVFTLSYIYYFYEIIS